MEYDFPVYRKYPNNKSYFKVLSPDTFEEVLVMGRYYSVHRFTAKILPDRNLISDMLDLSQGHWVISDESEHEAFLTDCIDKLQKASGSI